jgi:PKD repeat protein
LDISLTSHTFDFTDNTGISVNFWHKYWTEQDWDFAKVEYNIGSGWVSVATYDGTQNSWIQEQIQIPQLDGQPNARLRFHFTSDSNTHYDGWHIDDISINAGGPQCLPPLQPITEFTSNSPVSLGQPVIFTNRTAGAEPMVYNWNFGDGVGTSTETNPSYTYADIGTYTVTLIATNTLGMDSITHPTTVEPAAITRVDLTRVTTDTIFLSDSVDFSADLMPDIAVKPYDYTIDFGDSWVITGTSGMDPLFFYHIFSTGGSHTVKISVKNDVMGKTVTDSLEIYVNYKIFLPLTTK